MRRDDPDASALAAAVQLPGPAALVCEALTPLLSDERIARIDAVIAHRTRTVVPVLEAVDDPRNVAAILRSADAFGLQEVHLIEGAQEFLVSRRVTQGAERWIDLVRHPSPSACVASLHARGFRVYVATMQGELRPEDLRDMGRVALVFGNEHDGASPALLSGCDGRCSVPMRGFSQSLNVSVAAAVALYTLARERGGDLTEDERSELRARFMLLSVERGEQIVAEHLARFAR
jgi:tRNA (guanosine-2'-O-)-methyltransferase